ncbi:MAG: FAD-binding oxidoreductase [Flavobacteriales bacterium]|nr:FAD-binding oxidoreductase [Flavobacteriales bacterium]
MSKANDTERIDLHSGLPYWLVRNPIGPHAAPLDRSITTDVVIVGGGITGALCAYSLSDAGIPVVVVDARSFGTGSTCASTALLQYEIDTPLHELVSLVGEQKAIESYQLSVASLHRVEAIARKIGYDGLHTRSSIQYASKASHVKQLEKEYDVREKNGIPVEFISQKEEVEALLSFGPPALLLNPMAAETDALEFAKKLFEVSAGNGAIFHEHTEITNFQDTRSGIRLTTKDGHTIGARYLIYATGYEVVEQLPKNVIDLNSTYAMISTPMDSAPWPNKSLIWETAKPYLYMRTAPDGRIIVGGRDEEFRSPQRRDALLKKKTVQLIKDFNALFPHHPFTQEFAWCGTFGSTKDGLPYIDRGPQQEHSFYALGMGGNGITFSVIAADLIRDRILGRINKAQDLFRFDR